MSSRGLDPVASGMERCPFLRRLASTQGESYARNIAVNPAQPALAGGRRPIFEEVENFARTFRLFHGPDGVVPLTNREDGRPRQANAATAAAAVRSHSVENQSQQPSHKSSKLLRNPKGIAPLVAPAASMSLSNFGFLNGLGDFLNRRNNSDHPNSKKSKGSKSSKGGGGGKGNTGGSRGKIGATGAGLSAAAAVGSSAGKCPLRKYFGPLATMVMTGRYTCPPVVVKMRGMLARTQVVRSLRPEGLPVKILAVMAVSSALNIPFGALREHCKKFSPAWFLVVHATIPFVAMFRKAVVMPQYALIFTIAAAIGGQMVGARMERKRLASIPSAENAEIEVDPPRNGFFAYEWPSFERQDAARVRTGIGNLCTPDPQADLRGNGSPAYASLSSDPSRWSFCGCESPPFGRQGVVRPGNGDGPLSPQALIFGAQGPGSSGEGGVVA